MFDQKSYDRKRYRSNTTIVKNRSSKWRIKNRESLNLFHWNKLAYNHNLKGMDLQKQFIEQDKKCFYCKIDIDNKNLPSVEHYTPKSNIKIVISCKDCNRLKWDRNGDDFLIFIKEYISRFKE